MKYWENFDKSLNLDRRDEGVIMGQWFPSSQEVKRVSLECQSPRNSISFGLPYSNQTGIAT